MNHIARINSRVHPYNTWDGIHEAVKVVFFSHDEPQARMADAVAGEPLWSRHGDINLYGAQTANGFQEFRPSDRLCVPPNVRVRARRSAAIPFFAPAMQNFRCHQLQVGGVPIRS